MSTRPTARMILRRSDSFQSLILVLLLAVLQLSNQTIISSETKLSIGEDSTQFGIKLSSAVSSEPTTTERIDASTTTGKDSTYATSNCEMSAERREENSPANDGALEESAKDQGASSKREEKSNEHGLFKFWSTLTETANKKGEHRQRTTKQSGHYVTVEPLQSKNFKNTTDDDLESKYLDIDEKYVMEASDYGISKMKELYEIEEPKLYNMGLWLESDNPARFVATFNWQSEEARKLAQYGYASLQASSHLRQKLNDEFESRVADRKPPKLLAARSSVLRQQCPLRGVPRCPSASKRFRTHDGTCNNRRRGRWGSALTPVERFLPPRYEDEVSMARGEEGGLPSPRLVSSIVHTGRRKDMPEVSHLLMQWGQFLDHDVTSSSQARAFNGSVPRCCLDGGRDFVPEDFMHPECMPIDIPEDDEFFGPLGIRCMEFVRSAPAPRVDCEFGWREQMNQVTAYIDASPIYSSSVRQADKLRLFRNGMLQYGRAQARRPLLPPREEEEEALCQGGAVDSSCFKAGDGRVNEHPGLVAMHIIWLRKHNRIATELAHLNPHWSDEKIYQETRKMVGAFVQHITYKEFLPIVLGAEVMKLFDLDVTKKGYYNGYSSKVNPSPANAFGAAAFRFGHSLVQDSFIRYDRFHRPLSNNVSLHDELSNPSNIWSFGAVDRLVLGMCNQPSQKRDEFISPELTNHLFQTSRFGFGMDLAAINIQRGRDHGLPPYCEWRVPCGLTPVENWDDLLNIMPVGAVRNLQDVYRSVDDIDLFTGGMAERPVVGGLVGPTFACIIAQQFSNLRRGDRFWYENGGFESSFTPAQLQQIKKVTLAQILCQTLDNIETIQPFVFLTVDDFRNSRISCGSRIFNNFDFTPWTERDFDFTNSVNDRTNFVKSTPLEPNTTLSFSTPPTLLGIKGTSEETVIDDKLDLPDRLNNTSDETETTFFNKETNLHNSITNETEQIDDKLDFLRNNIHKDSSKNVTSAPDISEKRSFPSKENPSIKIKINNSISNQNVSLKTYGFLLGEDTQIPFFSSLFGDTKTTTEPPKPLLIQATESTPNKFTYLINIVPKTTTPKYNHRETIKITVQGSNPPSKIRPQYSSFPYEQRPVYENNNLQYRPISAIQNNVYNYDDQQSSYNRPNNVNNYQSSGQNDFSSSVSNNRPYRPYRPTSNQDYTTESNPYHLVTFSHVNSQYDFDQIEPDLTQNFYGSNTNKVKPTVSSDTNYRPIYNTKPTNGITIYIENSKPILKPVSDDGPYYSNGEDSISPRPSYQSSFSSSDENLPLFTRPGYQKPFLNKPLNKPLRPSNDNQRPSYSSSSPSNNVPLNNRPLLRPTPNDDQRPSYSNVSPSNNVPLNNRPLLRPTPNDDQRPSYSNLSPSNNVPFNTRPLLRPTQNDDQRPSYSNSRPSNVPLESEHGQISYSWQSRPVYAGNNNIKPPKVNVNVASQSGNQHHSDISIVIDPNLNNKVHVQTSPGYYSQYKSISTEKPIKFFYIGNVLHKYDEEKGESKIANVSEVVKAVDKIVKENYNNIWKPDRDEHKLYDDPIENDDEYIEVNDEDEDEDEDNKSNLRQIPEKTNNRPTTKKPNRNKNKNKGQVFFDVIPSDNGVTAWKIYNEKPEEIIANNPYKTMPKMNPDPEATKELPRPMKLH